MVNTWKIILATLVIFGAGVITGGLLVGHSLRAAHRLLARVPTTDAPLRAADRPSAPVKLDAGIARASNPPPAVNLPFRKDFLIRLDRELELSPEQRQHIEKIIREGQERTRELWRVEWVTTRKRIRSELTPEQQARFEGLFKSRPRDQQRPSAATGRSTNSPAPSGNPPAD
jgi:hypothetical protein